MTSPRMVRLRRGALALGQAGLGALLVGGVAWAGTQPAVVARVTDLDIVRDRPAGETPGSTTVALEQLGLACPGPELVGLPGAREIALATSAVVVAAPPEVVGDVPRPQGAPTLEILPLGASPTAGADDAETDPPAAESSAVLTTTIADPTAYVALGSGAAAPGLVATQETRADTDEVVGLGTVPCQSAGPTAWVLGGGGGPGRAERLVLTNPGSTAVTVDVTVHGSSGVSSPPDGQGLVVPARGRTVLLGDALALDEATPAFHVTATGGDVTAALVETSIDGTQPRGVDVASAAAPPSQEQVIAGVEVPAEGAGTVVVRVLNPGETETIGTVSALTATGERPIPEAVVRVAPGAVVDVPIAGLPAGQTTLAVAADAPVVAAARTFVGDRGIDSAWAASRPPLTEVAGAALPRREGVARTLVVSSRGAGATVAVTQASAGAPTTTEILVPTDGTVTVPLTGDGVWVRAVEGSGAVHAAVVSGGVGSEDSEGSEAGLSSMPLTVPATSARRSQVVPLG